MAIKLEARLEGIAGAAVQRATLGRHPAVTLEHLVRALIDEPEAGGFLAGLGADRDEMRRELDEILALIDEQPARGYRRPRLDAAASRTLQRASWSALSVRRSDVRVADFLAALVRERDAYPVMLLHAAGISPIDVLRAVAHGTHDLSLPETRARRLAVWLHNDDYTTMEFVVSALRSIFRLQESEATRFMLIVHNEGRAAVGDWPAEVALGRARDTMRAAEAAGYPLRVTVEEL